LSNHAAAVEDMRRARGSIPTDEQLEAAQEAVNGAADAIEKAIAAERAASEHVATVRNAGAPLWGRLQMLKNAKDSATLKMTQLGCGPLAWLFGGTPTPAAADRPNVQTMESMNQGPTGLVPPAVGMTGF
jgi:hypothetical protein